MSNMEFHPLAAIFPLIEGADYDALVEDIAANGLRERIVIYDGMVLDGRNRYRACVDAGVPRQFKEYVGHDPLGFVISLNLKRRHMSESQRAMVGARLANLEHGQRQTGQLAGVPTQEQASEMLNVGERTVRRAREVVTEGTPELQSAVEQGRASVSAAAEVASLPPEEQVEIVARGADEIIRVANKLKAERKHVRGTFGTGENEWYTPADFVEAARDVLGAIDLDPASSDVAQETVRAGNYFTAEDDGLAHEWQGKVWLNPPYAQPFISDFVAKMVEERLSGNVTAGILLTHNYTDTSWFQKAAGVADAICFTRGRVKFTDANGVVAAPTQGQAFFYFGPEADRFAARFARVGFVVRPLTGGAGDE